MLQFHLCFECCSFEITPIAPLIFIMVISGFQTALFWSHLTAVFSLTLSAEIQLCTYDHIMQLEREEGYYWGMKKNIRKGL